MTPEMELAFFREARGAGRPSVKASEVPASSLERTMDSKPSTQTRVIYGPPPPETGDVPDNLLPPRSGRVIHGREEKEAFRRVADVQASNDEKVEPLELPSRDLTEEEKQQLLERLGDARIQELDQKSSGPPGLEHLGRQPEHRQRVFNHCPGSGTLSCAAKRREIQAD